MFMWLRFLSYTFFFFQRTPSVVSVWWRDSTRWCNHLILDLLTGRAASAHSPPPFSEDLFPAAPLSCGTPRVEARSLQATAAPPAGLWSGAPTAAAGGLRGTMLTRCGSYGETMKNVVESAEICFSFFLFKEIVQPNLK